MEKILVATFDQDLTQFEMFCVCLAKYWKGEKTLDVIVGKNSNPGMCNTQDIVSAEQIASKFFDDSWAVKIIDGTIDQVPAFTEMSVNKVIHSDVNTLVCDSKDFLLKPSDMSDYIIDNKYCVNFFFPNQTHDELYDNILGKPAPAVSSMTPWIWSRDICADYLSWLQENHGPYNTWKEFPGYYEYCIWFLHAWNTPTVKNKLITDSNSCPLRFGGIWFEQNAQGSLNEEQDFDCWPERKWWKHTRKVNNTVCLDVTCRVLEKYGIDPEYVNDWKKRKVAETTSLTVG